FEQLQQSRERQPVGSAGLGLTFSRMATETLGGRIWVEDPPEGSGSVFKIELPFKV
ncbi:MAG: ATP-binding protein, partial [Nitrospirae bacterium]